MRMLVLGAGLQGSACAYDLLQNPDVTDVRLAAAVRAFFQQGDAVMSAIPYYFNLELARLAVESKVHFCDLGGNTEIVFQQKGLDAAAHARGVTIIPDCGLAPGMVNILAQCGISQLDAVSSVRIFVG